MAGAVGVSPWSCTYGELSLMAEGRDEAEWWHTAGLMSIVLGVVGVKRTPAELNPYEAERKRIKDPKRLAELAEIDEEANRVAWRAFVGKFTAK